VAAALGGLESVHVLPPDLARAASGDDPRRIARQIGANLLLRGSVRLTRTRLRVSYSLFHPYRGVQVAAQTLEATRAELFLLEDRMVAGIVQRIGQAKPAGRPPTRPDPAARERYLQALGDLLRYDYEPSVDSAIRILESLSAGDPQNATYAAALGRAYLYKYRLTIHGGWDNRAAQACHRALTLAPDAPDVLQCLGELHLSVGRTDDAVRELEAVVRARPESAGDYSALARAYRAAGRMDEAERMCRRAIALQPEYWGHRNALGRLLYHQGRFQEAADAWREMTRLSPDSAMGYRNLASALFRLDRLEESVENYRRSIRIEPVSRTYSDMGGALYWLGRYDEALEALRTCVSLREADPVAWGNLGSAYRWTPGYEGLAAEPLDRAIGLMRQHLDRHPGNAEDWANLASWLANRDRHAEAAQAAEHAVTLPSLDVNSMAMVGSVFHVLGRPSEALRWLAEAVDRGYGITRLERNPALQGLQGDPRFTRILDTARSRAGGASPATGGEQHGREEGERKDR
jgi:tetratricopeptide (TPR) repeat protein